MLVIAITGGICSGKSVVADMLRDLTFPVLDSDRVAHKVYEKGTDTYRKLIEHFGLQILLPDGSISRDILGGLVFHDRGARLKLETITHPSIEKRMRSYVKKREAEGCQACFVEVPLIFEKGKKNLFNLVITVFTTRDTQIDRLKSRDSLSRAEAQTRINSQMPLSEKVRSSDYVIDNSGTLEETIDQVKQFVRQEILSGKQKM